jgi:hypothetical protein
MKYLLIAIVAGLLFIPFLGAVPLFDPPEAVFANAAREMVSSGRYSVIQTGAGPVYDQFPLFIWIQAGSMELFGLHPFAARFPNAIMGIITLLTLYGVGRKQGDSNLGIWWAIVYAACWLPFTWFRAGLPDAVYNYFIFLSVYFAYRTGYTVKPVTLVTVSGLCMGLAVLTKGPAPILLSLLTWLLYWISSKGKTSVRFSHVFIIMLLSCLPPALWLIYTGFTQGWAYPGNFCRYQAAMLSSALLNRSFYYWVLLPGCFPAFIFLLAYLQKRRQRSVYTTPQPMDMKDLHTWMWSLCLAALPVCPSFIYLPVTFLAARQVYRIAEGRAGLRGWHITLLLIVGIAMGLALMLLPLAGVYRDTLGAYISHPFARAWAQAAIYWAWWEIIYGLLYILVIINSAVMLIRRNYQAGLLLLFMGSIAVMLVTLLHFASKIEKLLAFNN